jgi:hypothetical protein
MSRYSIALGKKPPKVRKKAVAKKKGKKVLSQKAKASIISRLLQTAEGRQRLAQSMAQPLRRPMDYESIGRRAFSVQPLPEGALPIYAEAFPERIESEKERYLDSVVIGKGAPEIQARVSSLMRGRRVLVPLFELAANPTIPLTEIRERRFDLIERAQELARVEIQQFEAEQNAGRLEDIRNIRPRPRRGNNVSGGVIGKE